MGLINDLKVREDGLAAAAEADRNNYVKATANLDALANYANDQAPGVGYGVEASVGNDALSLSAAHDNYGDQYGTVGNRVDAKYAGTNGGLGIYAANTANKYFDQNTQGVSANYKNGPVSVNGQFGRTEANGNVMIDASAGLAYQLGKQANMQFSASQNSNENEPRAQLTYNQKW